MSSRKPTAVKVCKNITSIVILLHLTKSRLKTKELGSGRVIYSTAYGIGNKKIKKPKRFRKRPNDRSKRKSEG